MADETINIDVPPATWTSVASLPGAYLLTGNDNWQYAYATSEPAEGFLGHHVYAQVNEQVVPTDGQAVWVYAHRPMRLAVTSAED